MTKKIQGSGGGGSRNRTPQRAPDTLNSRQFASILDLFSEGEIEGFSTASKAGLTFGTAPYLYASLKDVFLDDTPVLKETASNTAPQPNDFNFSNVRFDFRTGTATQGIIPGIASSSSVTQVNTVVTVANDYDKTITKQQNQNIDAIKVVVSFDQIQLLKDNGDIEGSSVQLKIKAGYNNGTQTTVIDDTVTGRTADPYQKEYRFNVDKTQFNATGNTLQLTVERVTSDTTAEHTAGTLNDTMRVLNYEEVVDDSNTYPNCAYSLLRLDSEQFSNIPKRVFKIRGIKVRIPGAGANNSGTPQVVKNQAEATALGLGTVSSFGFIHYPAGYIFNGTMQAATWTTCPAMILLDVLTSERYGFGTHLAPNFDDSNPSDVDLYENVDLFSLVAASKYANALVSDLSTSTGAVKEPRFSCNVNIQATKEAFDLINELSGIMRCFPIWQTGSLTITQDRNTDSSYLFSLANVSEEGFNYTGSSLKQRHSMIHISYFNMDTKEMDTEVIQDQAAINKIGIVTKQIRAFGTTSRGQAIRLGKAILFSEQQESEIVTFETSIEAGVLVRPGNVISVNDPVRSGERRSGRIKAATTTQITVDSIESLSSLSGATTAFIIMPNGSVEEKTCTLVGDKINLISALSAIPNVNSVWMLSTAALEPQTFRVITVEEKDELLYTITALRYLEGKYNNIDIGTALPAKNISLLNQPKPAPTNLRVSDKQGNPKEMIVTLNGLAVSKLLLTWTGVSGVSQYLVQYRFNNGNYINEVVFRTDFEVLNTEAGLYEFKVYSYNAALVLSSSSADLSFVAVGKTEPPGNVDGLTIEPVTNKLVRLRWQPAIDPDVLHGGRVYVRHSSKTDGTGTFQNSVDLIEALAGNSTDAVVPSLEGEYILKFRDDQGNFSKGENSVIYDLPDLIDQQQILSDREDTDSSPFAGTKTNVEIVGDGLQLTNPATHPTGTYDFAVILDCLGVYSLNLRRIIQAIGFASAGQTISATYVRTTATISGQSQTVIQITTLNSTAHARSVGDYVDFVAITGGATNGVFQIVAVPSSTTFQFLATGSAISSSNCTFAFVNTIDELIPAGTFWDDYAPNGQFDGPLINDTNAIISVATTSVAPTNGSSYTDSDFPETGPSAIPFNTFANGTYKGRGFKFRVTLKSETVGHNISIQQLGIIADFESRTERSYVSGVTTLTTPITSTTTAPSGSNTGGLDVTFGNKFFVGTANLGGVNNFPPSVGITIMDADGGDYFVIKTNAQGHFLNAAGQDITGLGFNIRIYDVNNNLIAKKFTFQAVGYGKGV